MSAALKIDPGVIFAPDDYVNHWNDIISDKDYHADRTAINSSSLKWMIKSAHAFYGVFFLNQGREPTEAMKFGTLAHMAMLEGAKFRDRYIIVPDFGDLRSSKNRAERQRFLNDLPAKAIPVDKEDRERLLAMIDSTLSHPEASRLLSNGKPEVTGYWRDPETGLRMRMKADFLPFNLSSLIDVKTTQDSTWEAFRKSVESPKIRMDVQMAMYEDGIEKITGVRPETSAWLAVESVFPYEVACHEVPPQYKQSGDYEYQRCKRRIAECAKSNLWPQAQTEIEMAEMSPWFFNNYMIKGAFHDLID